MSAIDVKHRTQGRAADSGGMFTDPTRGLLDTPEAQPVLARLAAQVDPFSTIDTIEHVRAVAAVVLQAKRRPRNSFAVPTS